MSSFTIKKLVNGRSLVSGTDRNGVSNTMQVMSHRWEEIKRELRARQALVEFDHTIEKFYKPLEDAADKFNQTTQPKPADPLSYIDIESPEEATPGSPGKRIELDRDSIILRTIETGQFDRLVWVGSELVILVEEPGPEVAAPPLF